MEQDLYAILGVRRGASDDDIRRSYKKLAKKYHPDRNPDDKSAEETFKRISAAYNILGDPEKRKRYDRGEIDATGQETADPFFRDYGAGGGHRSRRSAGGDFSDLFGDLFGRTGTGSSFHMRGMDYRYHLEIEFLEAVNGMKKRVLLPEGETLDISVPSGVEEGQVLRLKGKGGPGVGRGQAGDALIELTIRPHPFFEREGDNIVLELPITLDEAVLGGKVEAPTIDGRVSLTIPRGASSGQVLRLRGKGVKNARTRKTGDQLVKLKIVLPARVDAELQDFFETWRKGHRYDPRARLKEAL